MPRIKIDYVVSFSSEDPEHPASNLLATEISKKKWLCANKGESSMSIVLQLVKCTQITSVHIGSYDTALIEVLVGRSETPNQPFKVLVLSSIFMTPIESRKGAGTSKVRTFNYEQLSEETRQQPWDRIRVVCQQPYNKHCKYGLNFIHIYEPESTGSNVNSRPAVLCSNKHIDILNTNSSDEDDTTFKPGELFASMRGNSSTSADAQIRLASTPSALKHTTQNSLLVKTPLTIDKTPKVNTKLKQTELANKNRESLLYQDDEISPHTKIDMVIERDRRDKDRIGEESNKSKKDGDNCGKRRKDEGSGKRKRDRSERGKIDRSLSRNENKDKNRLNDSSSDKDRNSKRRCVDTGQRDDGISSNKKEISTSDESSAIRLPPPSSEPHTIMNGVVFVISGYVNPERSQLRDKALMMGAKYRQDWGPGCTHLICAFPNTPKLRQVRSCGTNAIIVTGDWIKQCCSERRLLPHVWYATEPEFRVTRPESCSEDTMIDKQREEEEDCDTDDEIQKVLEQQKQENMEQVKLNNTETRTKSPRSESTDCDEDDTKNMSRESDVAFIKDERIKAEIDIGSDSDTSTDVETSITMRSDVKVDSDSALPSFFDGLLFAIDDKLKDYDQNLLKRYIIAYGGEVITFITETSKVDYVITDRCDCNLGRRVRPEWIWSCHEAGVKISTKDYLVCSK